MVAALNRVVPRAAAAFRLLWALGPTVGIAVWGLVSSVPEVALVAASAMVSWAVLVFVIVWRRGAMPVWVVPIDAGLFAALLLAERWLVAPHLVGDGTNWIMTGATVSVLMAGWVLASWQGLAVTGGLTVAYVAGLYLAGLEVGRNQAFTALVLIVQGGLAVAIVAIIARASRRADAAVARRASTERAAVLEVRREQAREEQDRTLHDQVGTSLWLLGRGLLNHDNARVRAREAVDSLRRLAAGRPAAPHGDTLVQRLSAVVDELRTAGLDVEVVIEPLMPRTARLSRRPAATESPLGWLPGVVIDAVSAATGEALANVLAHTANTGTRVLVRHGPSRVTVEVSDTGAGFDPARIRPDRAGVRRSIVGRMEEVGGTATVTSVTAAESPDAHGTTWILAWEGAERSQRRSATLTRAAMAEYGTGFLTMFAVIAAVFHALGLVTVLTQPSDYWSPAVAMGSWIAVAAAGLALYTGVERRWSSAPWAYVAAAVIVSAGVVLVLDCRPGAALGFANWALGDAGWFLALLGAYLPARQTATALGMAALTNAVTILIVDRPDAEGLVKLLGILVGVGTLQAGAVIGFGLMRRAATTTATSVWTANELVAARIADAEARDRGASVFHTMDTEILEVLTDVARGLADPLDEHVRQRCLRGRDVLRQDTMLRQAGVGDLAPLAAAATRAGLRIRFPVLHRFDRVPAGRRQQMVEVLMAGLAFARPGAAVVTVQDNADLAMLDGPRRVNHLSSPLSLTFRFYLVPKSGTQLREKISKYGNLDGLHVDLDLSDDEGNAGDEDATLAWLAVVCSDDDGRSRR